MPIWTAVVAFAMFCAIANGLDLGWRPNAIGDAGHKAGVVRDSASLARSAGATTATVVVRNHPARMR
jgi:hypothetical protein